MVVKNAVIQGVHVGRVEDFQFSDIRDFLFIAGAGEGAASFTGFPYQASASSLVTNPLYRAPGNPCTCFWQSGQL